MTTISHDDIGRARKGFRRPRSPEELAATRSRRFWMWASAAWLIAVSVTAVVATGQAVTVAIGGMTLAAVCYALAWPEPAVAVAVTVTPAPEGAEPQTRAVVEESVIGGAVHAAE
ncbi:hypothetical protein ABH926_005923 [Catenulispora sp. GP43]|uniref:hypothetical protein n=1 Tax=Catenulispora sp. GP43 TaxID=3156263 RepID=UPI003510EE2D